MTLIKSFESFKSQSSRIFVANPEAESIIESFSLSESEGLYFGENLDEAIEALEENGFSSPMDFIPVPLNEALGQVRYEGHESSPEGTEIFISINGHKYGYVEKPYDDATKTGGIDAGDLARKFEKMLQFSAGKALAWLKKHTILKSGGKSTEKQDVGLIIDLLSSNNLNFIPVKEGHEKHEEAPHVEETPVDTPVADSHDMSRYMFFQNLKTIKSCIDKMIEMNPAEIDGLLNDGHDWAEDHIATSKDDIQEVCDWLCNNIK